MAGQPVAGSMPSAMPGAMAGQPVAGSTAAEGTASPWPAGTVPPPPYTAAGYENLAPPLGEPLPMDGSALTPPAPDGWVWHEIDGAVCRDGSPTGFFVHYGTANKLLFYMEGGGACSNAPFCGFNPANKEQILSGDGQIVLGSALGAVAGRQQPGVYTGGPMGVFDFGNAQNPFKDWSQIYVPYCTGDVHFGTRRDVTVPGLPQPQQYVGYLNMQKFVGRIVPTFADKVDQVVMTGASAGGFGAALNFSMVQDAFGDKAHVVVIDDSGPPFLGKYMPECMQERWRAQWGFGGSLPTDCEECKPISEGGLGLGGLAEYALQKHPQARLALISSMEDEVIRLFFSVGLQDCANYDSADPVGITITQFDPTIYYPAMDYQAGLQGLRDQYVDTGMFSSYYMGGLNVTFHQHIFRQRFYETAAGGTPLNKFVEDFLAGTMSNVGP